MQKESSTRWWDLASAFLLIVAMSTVANRLVATDWTYHLDITQTIAFFGVITGLALGKSRFSPRFASFIVTIYGLFLIIYQLGSNYRKELLWSERLSIITNRSGLVVYQSINQEIVQDSILFLIFMCILFWSISTYAGYSLVRHGNAWKTVIPGGLTIFVIHYFDPYLIRNTWYLAVYLFFALLIISRLTFLKQKNRWQQSQTALPPHLGFDFIRFTTLVTFVIILLAWTIPAMANALPAAQKAWQPIRSALSETRARFDFAFASLRSSVSLVNEYYGISTSLGRGAPLADTLIFSVEAPPKLPPGVRLYWRARSYDSYEDSNWLSSFTSSYDFNPEEDDLPIPQFSGRWLGSFNITSATSMNTLFTPAQPIWVNRSGNVEYVDNPDGTVDISTFRASPDLEPGQEYRVQASVSYASEEELRAAGTEYPEWITERYLSLPDSITPRTVQLAQDITAGLETPYDKVTAVTNYLRNTITYIDFIEDDIPLTQERIDWFLFDYQKGFCNYYSTAEIVLLRSIGIPARWSVGFAQGERVTSEEIIPGSAFESGTYIVRQHSAHSWPEVYFPDIGWVEFEPTTSEPEIIRQEYNPLGKDAPFAASDQPYDYDREEFKDKLDRLREERDIYTNPDTSRNWMEYGIMSMPLIALAVLVYLGWRFRSHFQWQTMPVFLESAFFKLGMHPPAKVQLWARRSTLPPLYQAYQEINQALSRLGHQPKLTDTPEERAQNLVEIIPSCEKATRDLVNEYIIEVFSDQSANLVVAIRSANEIKKNSFKALFNRFLQLCKKPFELIRQKFPKICSW